MDLKVPIVISDELTEQVIVSTGSLNLASGEINRVEYQDYSAELLGLPFENKDYEFTSGVLSNNGRDVEFTIDVDKVTGQYSVSASELLEIKLRAAALFTGVGSKGLQAHAEAKAAAAGSAVPAPAQAALPSPAPAAHPVSPRAGRGRVH